MPESSGRERRAERPSTGDGPVVGIACSGGGIRAAAYALGCLQVLSEHGVLRGERGDRFRAHYLAAVSGGSYAAGAFALLEYHRQHAKDPAALLPDVSPYAPGSPEIRRLRNRLTYLTHPSGGLYAEVWQAVMGVVMNLALFVAVAAVIGYVMGWLYGWSLPQLRASCGGRGKGCSTAVHPPSALIWLSVGLAVAGLGVGVIWVMRRWGPRAARWWRPAALWVAAFAVAWGLIVLAVPQVLAWLHRATLPRPPSPIPVSNGIRDLWIPAGGLAGVLAAIGAVLAPVWRFLRPQLGTTASPGWLGNLLSRYRQPLLNLVAMLAVPAFFGGLLVLFLHDGSGRPPLVDGNSDWRFLAAGAPLLFLLLVKRYGDLNNWSLHSLYKQRLAEAFALARVSPPADPLSTTQVDGVDADHEHSWPVPLEHMQPRRFPEVLICATSNITTYGVAPTGTGALPFLFSAASIGGPAVGSLDTGSYSRWGLRATDDLTAMDAVSISGAAISPEMGRLTRPALRFLMTLANLRLGVWIPKPARVKAYIDELHGEPHGGGVLRALRTPVLAVRRRRGARERRRPASDKEPDPSAFRHRRNRGAMPQAGVQKLVNEALGITPPNSRFVYVTDGGHYDNLGLVELLRRRCDWIWCIDASGDKVDTFKTLGLALSIAKSEYRIDVDIHPERDMATVVPHGPVPASPAGGTDIPTPFVKQSFCRGTIRYPAEAGEPAREGTLVVIKAGVPTDSPLDLLAFHAANHQFPCDPTINQLYSADRFDAYLGLGRHSMSAAVSKCWRSYGQLWRQTPTRARSAAKKAASPRRH